MNFVVCDMGSDFHTQMEQANSADILLLVCGTKPYEISATLQLKKQFETTHAFILCPFVDEDSKATYVEGLQSDYPNVLFLGYQPDLMDSTANAKLFKTMIANLLLFKWIPLMVCSIEMSFNLRYKKMQCSTEKI